MRIAIVNDVGLAVDALRRVLREVRRHEIAWVAADGEQAIELCARDLPAVILMDLFMPRVNGVEATRRIMAHSPCPILIVTADVIDHSRAVFEAMGAGALDAVNTPILELPGAWKGANVLLDKIETIGRLVGASARRGAWRNGQAVHGHGTRPRHLVVIGASAGGPAALARILGELRADFPAPIVAVQHVDAQFSRGLVNWLDSQTALEVKLAREGDQPEPGSVLLAEGGLHLVFSSPSRLGYARNPVDYFYRPSVDIFFRSVQRYRPGSVIGVLLTGMGKDGAEGLRTLHKHGCHTIVQDQTSSAVYGMPKAAIQMGAASEILPLDKIAARLTTLVKKTRVHA